MRRLLEEKLSVPTEDTKKERPRRKRRKQGTCVVCLSGVPTLAAAPLGRCLATPPLNLEKAGVQGGQPRNSLATEARKGGGRQEEPGQETPMSARRREATFPFTVLLQSCLLH